MEIRLALVAHGIQFEADVRFLFRATIVRGATGKAERRARSGERGELEKLTAGESVVGFHIESFHPRRM
jgi:hypothetical protein